MRIKGYKQFLEAVSGTELVGNHMGPAYPSQDNSPMKKIGLTDVIYSNLFDVVVSQDEYQDLYNQYRKNLGQETLQDFTLENLDKILTFLREVLTDEEWLQVMEVLKSALKEKTSIILN